MEFAAHSCAEIEGEFGVWGYVKGGMGALSDALRVAAEHRGAVVETDVAVDEIVVTRGKARGVRLANGVFKNCKFVVSNADPHVTFSKLLPADALPARFRHAAENIDFRGSMARLHYAVDKLPSWRESPRRSLVPSTSHSR